MRWRGFTIIELMVTLLVISILLALGTVNLTNARKNARDNKRLGDILLTANAIDQAVLTTRGTYPRNKQGGNEGSMCLSEMIGNANDTQGIDLSLFPNREMPVDPLAVAAQSSNCSGYQSGYTYHTNYGPSIATDEQYAYILEVGLEREKTKDESLFVDGTSLGLPAITTPRYQYFLLGKYCGTDCF